MSASPTQDVVTDSSVFTAAEHLEKHNQYAHAYLQRALKCQAGQRQHERYLHFAHVCNMIVHDVRAGKAEGDAMEW